VVAHRLSTIAKADVIFVVDNGRIIEQGTHQSLISQNGSYAQLVSKQKIDTDESLTIQDLVKEEVDDTSSSFHMCDDKSSLHGQQQYRLMRVLTGSTGISDRSNQSQKLVSYSMPQSTHIRSISQWQILKQMRSEWKMLTLGFIGAVLQGATMPAYGYCFSYLIGTLGTSTNEQIKNFQGLDGVNLCAFLLFIIGVSSFIGFSLGGYCFFASGQHFAHRLRVQMFASYLKQEIAFFDVNENNAGILVSKLAGDTSKVATLIADVWGKSIEVVVAVGLGVAISCIFSWQITLIAMALVPFIMFSAYSEIYIFKKFETKNKEALHESSKVASEVIREIRTVASLNKQAHFQQLYMAALASSHKLVILKAKAAATSIFHILHRQVAIDIDLEGIEPSSVQGDVELKRIHFAYPTRPERPVFHGKFKLSITSGQSVALVGASGCGKSTIIGLLLRWYDTEKGTVAVDHTNVKSYSVKNLRKHMAVVSQEPVLFDMTIGENVRFGSDEDVTQDDVVEACKAANIHGFISELPEGYETRVGDKGSQLSGGQRQRIAIARALIRKPNILLLDEATSALDSESEQLVQEALDKIINEGKRTTITIAHRLSTITHSDVICVVDKGEVIEQGSHQELLALDGAYARLVYEQSLHK
jgi:ABC-type multidrug transport system fused ATPase/permease subunit